MLFWIAGCYYVEVADLVNVFDQITGIGKIVTNAAAFGYVTA